MKSKIKKIEIDVENCKTMFSTKYCPVCGTIIFDISEGEIKYGGCSHLVFIYDVVVGYRYKSNDFELRKSLLSKNMSNEDFENLSFDEILSAMEYGDEYVFIELISDGVAFAAGSYSLCFYIDYNGKTPSKNDSKDIERKMFSGLIKN